jgi:hypothetical protein
MRENIDVLNMDDPLKNGGIFLDHCLYGHIDAQI